jgi:hypothetical protein
MDKVQRIDRSTMFIPQLLLVTFVYLVKMGTQICLVQLLSSDKMFFSLGDTM